MSQVGLGRCENDKHPRNAWPHSYRISTAIHTPRRSAPAFVAFLNRSGNAPAASGQQADFENNAHTPLPGQIAFGFWKKIADGRIAIAHRRPATLRYGRWSERPGLSDCKGATVNKARAISFTHDEIKAHGQRIKDIAPEKR
jgi:hypothetical protein